MTAADKTKRPRGGNKRSQQAQGQARAREAAAVQMRVEGRTYQQIADALGYADPSAARQAYLRGSAELIADTKEEMRQNHALLMMSLGQAHLPKARGENVLKVLQQHAKLYGLDAPTQIEANINHFDGDGSDIDRRIAELSARLLARPDSAGESGMDDSLSQTDAVTT